MTNGPFDLTGKAALTGGNGGIGLGMAKGLAGAGAAVALLGRDDAKCAQQAAEEIAAEGGRAIAVTADVTSKDDVERAVAEMVASLGRLDILVNNAGINIRKPPQALELAEWHKVMDTNLTSALIAAQAAYPHMKAAGGGKIINIGSMMSIFSAPMMAAYAASKAGIVQLTKTFACAWAPDNIQANAVLPGWIDTDLTKGARRDIAGPSRSGAGAHAGRALGRPRRSGRHCRVPGLAGVRFRHRNRHPGRRRLRFEHVGAKLAPPWPAGAAQGMIV